MANDRKHPWLALTPTVSASAIQVIEQANAPILGVDTEGRINEWNRKAAQITGFEKTEVTAGRNCPMGVDRVLIGC